MARPSSCTSVFKDLLLLTEDSVRSPPPSQIDEFVHPKTGKKSLCYRINYRSMDSNVTSKEAETFTSKIKAIAGDKLSIEIR